MATRRRAAKPRTARGARAAAAPATDELIAEIERFRRRAWNRQPPDVARLRAHALPPMGNMPCMLYANFNTFWLGENLQTLRALARERTLALKALDRAAAALIARHAARLAKWKLTATARLLERTTAYFEAEGPRSHREFVAVIEALMLAADRINAWIDAAIPWSRLDKKLKALPPAA